MDPGDLWAAGTTAPHQRITRGAHVRVTLTLAWVHHCSLSVHFCLTRPSAFSPEVRSGIKDVLMKTIHQNRSHPSSGGDRPFSSVFARFHHLKQHSGRGRTFFNVKVTLRNGWRLDGYTLPLMTVEKQKKIRLKSVGSSRTALSYIKIHIYTFVKIVCLYVFPCLLWGCFFTHQMGFDWPKVPDQLIN